MRGWHFAGICRTLKHFYVWDLGFWYPFTAAPPPLSLWAVGQVFRFWDPIWVQLLLASTRPEVFEASCCHDTNLRSRASSRAIARYAGDSGIAKKESECKRGKMERERQGWREWWGGGGHHVYLRKDKCPGLANSLWLVNPGQSPYVQRVPGSSSETSVTASFMLNMRVNSVRDMTLGQV